ncbi:conjugative transposon protein TraM [Porphyromonas endodontalis]|uniref:Conjugative transposon TraM protein n=1 Tax=Porphyromonas endodontalis (strain ATCC 35406 / DSM 24491 / JCM 8526 / CCUG 16442 / BCRC 14492 / NCTC 13058 / HG 370) TaxID=553175 RepID=C3J968_POREA|nr:conjugative transposon protein TraM [Porphyromonas endodontalis]EEN83246.1 conjugative transposon TraM protein [Porphyromonas endodontalis ATCC 35406]UBH64512.1 conjugative transposon protein TraM [Porphyromonas endodontalis]SUB76588.1 Bacteroides conjugative transposon TraM protein [Porphyromonas endodontalis]
MFPFKRKTASDTSTSPELTEEERQRRKKFIIYPLMFLLFAGSMWLIFAPSEKEGQKQTKGFNTEVPDPTAAELIGDKKKAYEKEMMEEKEQERSRAMQSLSSMFGEMTGGQPKQSSEELALKTDLSERDNGFGSRTAAPQDGFHASASAYQDINRTLGSFYEAPREDPEKEELRARLAELENRMSSEQHSPAITVNDQMALLEKSYQLAAKYMPSGGGQSSSNMALASDGETASEGKAVAFPVSPVSEQVVSALAQPMSDSTFRSEYVKERNYIFHTAIGTAPLTEKNTISACVHTRQTVTDGQTVRFRLLEPMLVSGKEIPRNTSVVGVAKIQGERLNILISSLEYHGNIIPVELAVYDTDGQAGIFIPGSMERSAAKEIVAGMGTSAGSSMNFSTNAGAQLADDLGKGLIQGTSQYFSKKMRTVKVHLKAGYKVLLYQPDNK